MRHSLAFFIIFSRVGARSLCTYAGGGRFLDKRVERSIFGRFVRSLVGRISQLDPDSRDCRSSRISVRSLPAPLSLSLTHPGPYPTSRNRQKFCRRGTCVPPNEIFHIRLYVRVFVETKWSGSPLSLSLSSCLGKSKPRRDDAWGETLGPYGKQRNDDSNKGVMTIMDGIDNSSPCPLSPFPLSKQF